MAWLQVKGVLINLDNVKHFEKSKKSNYVSVHYLNDPTPLFIPFSSSDEAEKWFDALKLLLKVILKTRVIDGDIDLSKFN
ncbi:hypothetical protein [Desulfurobacterium sp.]